MTSTSTTRVQVLRLLQQRLQRRLHQTIRALTSQLRSY